MFLPCIQVEILATAVHMCIVPEAARDDSSGNFLWLDARKAVRNRHGFSWLLPVALVPWTSAWHTLGKFADLLAEDPGSLQRQKHFRKISRDEQVESLPEKTRWAKA